MPRSTAVRRPGRGVGYGKLLRIFHRKISLFSFVDIDESRRTTVRRKQSLESHIDAFKFWGTGAGGTLFDSLTGDELYRGRRGWVSG